MLPRLGQNGQRPIETFPAVAQHCCVRKPPLTLDDVDHHLLELLQLDAGRTLHELGDAVGLSPSAVLRRKERYRKSGLLARQVAVLDARYAPDVVLAVCLVTVERESPEHRKEWCKRMQSMPEVQQAYDVSGEWDYVVVLTAVGMSHMNELVERLCLDDTNVRKFTTLFVFDAMKTGGSIPTRRASLEG
jgi:Lrp/AsnC family leucine-responsive transcriptional regulator